MHRYDRIRPHQFNDGLAVAQAEKNLTSCPGLVDHYTKCLKREELRVERIAIGQGVTLGLRFAIWPVTPLLGVYGITHNVYYVKSCTAYHMFISCE